MEVFVFNCFRLSLISFSVASALTVAAGVLVSSQAHAQRDSRADGNGDDERVENCVMRMNASGVKTCEYSSRTKYDDYIIQPVTPPSLEAVDRWVQSQMSFREDQTSCRTQYASRVTSPNSYAAYRESGLVSQSATNRQIDAAASTIRSAIIKRALELLTKCVIERNGNGEHTPGTPDNRPMSGSERLSGIAGSWAPMLEQGPR
jgi:hypothetical protein